MKKILAIVLVLAAVLGCVFTFTACNKKDDNTLVVVTNCPFEPFEYIGDDGKIYGVDIEVAAGFAKSIGKKLVVKNLPDFDSIFPQVENGYADLGMAGITFSEDRAATFNFSTEYYGASQKLIVPINCSTFNPCITDTDVESALYGLVDKKVGYQNGTTGSLYIEGDSDWDFHGYSNITGKGYDSAQDAVTDLVNGNLFAVIVDEAPAEALVAATNASSDVVKIVDVKLTNENYAYIAQKSAKGAKLIEQLNAYLDEIQKNGELQKILDKYFAGTGTKVGQKVSA